MGNYLNVRYKEEQMMGSNKYYDCANEIIKLIGGNENVASAAHCATRLRLVVKDESLIKKKK